MRFSFAKKALTGLTALAAMTALGTSSANAGIIITIGDSPILSTTQIMRYLAEAREGSERGEDREDERHEAYGGHPHHRPSGYARCQSAETGYPQICPRPTSPAVDASGLPSEWSCYAIRPGVFYCDAPIFGAGTDAGEGGYAGAGDFESDDEVAVMGCGAAGNGSSAWLAALLGALGFGFARRRLARR